MSPASRKQPEVEVLVTADCPHASATAERVQEVLRSLELEGEGPVVRQVTEEEAREGDFPGSPTVRVAGRDIDPEGAAGGPSLSCRLYDRAGVPPRWRIEAALLRALAPRHLLFLCVANSARSQMAEGLARTLAPEGVRISSAGSEPSSVRPEAVRALDEVGIDAAVQRSKGVDEIDTSVDAVITLCAEEVCPVWLAPALRLHWGLPDPAAVEGEGRMDAFRETRDELSRRLEAIFGS